MKIYHNTRCSTSRKTLELIRNQGTEPTIVEYLKNPLTIDELKEILSILSVNVKDIIRTKEKLYKEEYKGKDFTDEEWLTILVENPKLIERPIIINDKKGVIGRPPENVLDLF